MTTYAYWEAYYKAHTSSHDEIDCTSFAFSKTLDSINRESKSNMGNVPDWKKTPLEILEDSLAETRELLTDLDCFSDLEILNMVKR